MATVAAVAKMFGISTQTVRIWTKEFEPHLSDEATPPKGEVRNYTKDDMRIFSLIAEMRKNKQNFEEIHMALRDGRRGSVSTTPHFFQLSASQDTSSYAFLDRLVRNIDDQCRSQIEQLENERDYLRRKLDQEQKKIEILMERAAKAETENRLLKNKGTK